MTFDSGGLLRIELFNGIQDDRLDEVVVFVDDPVSQSCRLGERWGKVSRSNHLAQQMLTATHKLLHLVGKFLYYDLPFCSMPAVTRIVASALYY